MKTSPAGIALIKRFEGCRFEAYQDIRGIWTIGYGETGPYVVPGLHYTQQNAEDGLARRLAAEFEPAVLEAIGSAATTQGQFDAMVSLAWNIGAPRFKGSTLAKLHRAGDYAGAAAEFAKWNKAGGTVVAALARRREEERALYLSNAAPSRPFTPASAEALQRRLVGLGYAIDIDGQAGPVTCGAALAALDD